MLKRPSYLLSYMALISLSLLAGSGRASAQVEVCGLPVCDIPQRIQEFRNSYEGQRWQWLNVYQAQVETLNDAPSLKNISQFAIELKLVLEKILPPEHGYQVRACDSLAYTALSKLATAEGTTIDELITYFGQITSNDVRYRILLHWRQKVETAPDRAALKELNKFFLAATQMTISNERWVHEQAAYGADAISQIHFQKHLGEMSQQEMIDMISQVSSDQVRYNIPEQIGARIESELSRDRALLLRLNATMLKAIEQAQGRADWVGVRAQQTLNLVNETLLKTQTTTEEMSKLFGQITSGEVRFRLLGYWRERSATLASRSTAEGQQLSQFLQNASALSASSEDWVKDQAQRAVDELSAALVRNPALTEAELMANFRLIKSTQLAFDILSNLLSQAQGYEGPDTWLLRINHFTSDIVDRPTSHEHYVMDKARIILEVVNVKLIKRPQIHADEMIHYFEQLYSDNARTVIFDHFAFRLKNYSDKASMLGLVKFLSAALKITENAESPYYVLANARNAEASATARLSMLFPVHEGVYEVSAGCMRVPNGEITQSQRCGSGVLDRIVLMNTGTNEGWQLSVMSSRSDVVSHLFSDVRLSEGATLLSSRNNAGGSLSEISLRFDPTTRSVKGWLKTSDVEGYIGITGKQTIAIDQVYDHQVSAYVAESIKEAQIVASQIQGTYGPSRASIKLRNIQTGERNQDTTIAGTIHFEGLNSYQLNIHAGSYNPMNGILTLFSYDSTGHRVKLTLAVNQSAGRLQLVGRSFKSNVTRANELSFTEIPSSSALR